MSVTSIVALATNLCLLWLVTIPWNNVLISTASNLRLFAKRFITLFNSLLSWAMNSISYLKKCIYNESLYLMAVEKVIYTFLEKTFLLYFCKIFTWVNIFSIISIVVIIPRLLNRWSTGVFNRSPCKYFLRPSDGRGRLLGITASAMVGKNWKLCNVLPNKCLKYL